MCLTKTFLILFLTKFGIRIYLFVINICFASTKREKQGLFIKHILHTDVNDKLMMAEIYLDVFFWQAHWWFT